jgi:hypothetical protein
MHDSPWLPNVETNGLEKPTVNNSSAHTESDVFATNQVSCIRCVKKGPVKHSDIAIVRLGKYHAPVTIG